MMLFILRRKSLVFPTYDAKNAALVRAESEAAARALLATPPYPWDEGAETWLNPAASTCEELVPEGPAGVILEDNNPG